MGSRTTALLALLAAAVLAACGGEGQADCESFRFDKALWKSPDSTEVRGELTDRQRLADRMIDCGALKGATATAVRDLLGKPDWRYDDRGEWGYYTGPERGAVSIDGENLVVFFKRRRVVRLARGEG